MRATATSMNPVSEWGARVPPSLCADECRLHCCVAAAWAIEAGLALRSLGRPRWDFWQRCNEGLPQSQNFGTRFAPFSSLVLEQGSRGPHGRRPTTEGRVRKERARASGGDERGPGPKPSRAAAAPHAPFSPRRPPSNHTAEPTTRSLSLKNIGGQIHPVLLCVRWRKEKLLSGCRDETSEPAWAHPRPEQRQELGALGRPQQQPVGPAARHTHSPPNPTTPHAMAR